MTQSEAALLPLKTVPKVDLKKYMGKWFEIARFPQRFEKNCYASTAEYSMNEKGYVDVVNSCRKGSIEGEIEIAKGKAFPEENSFNTKLKVQFRWPFKGKYWVIDLADDYSYAAVSHPNRKYLWILSRTPHMDAKTYQDILTRLKQQGLDTDKLIMTEQG